MPAVPKPPVSSKPNLFPTYQFDGTLQVCYSEVTVYV